MLLMFVVVCVCLSRGTFGKHGSEEEEAREELYHIEPLQEDGDSAILKNLTALVRQQNILHTALGAFSTFVSVSFIHCSSPDLMLCIWTLSLRPLTEPVVRHEHVSLQFVLRPEQPCTLKHRESTESFK